MTRHNTIHRHNDWNLDAQNLEPNSECRLVAEIRNEDLEEEEFQCHHCKVFSYLSQFRCTNSGKVSCLRDMDSIDCCSENLYQRLQGLNHRLILRFTDQELQNLVQKTVDKANVPQAWEARLEALLDDEARPALKQMHTLLTEGERSQRT